MVGGDDHEGVVPHAQDDERVEEPAELGVDVGDHARSTAPAARASTCSSAGAGSIGSRPQNGTSRSGRATGQRHVVGVVGRRPVPGRGVGRVRAPVAGVREPRAVLALEPLDDVVGQEGRDPVLGRAVGLGRRARRRRRRERS